MIEFIHGAESPDEFGTLVAEENEVLTKLPNHCFITPETFIEVKGAKLLSSKALAYTIIENFQRSVEDNDEISIAMEEEAAGLEYTLAMLWASENGMLTEIPMDDVPEDPMMSHIIKDVRHRLGNADTTGEVGVTGATAAGVASMDLMAQSSQSMVALLTKFQDGTDSDRTRRESEKSILKTMGPTQRDLFTALCTRNMSRAPAMSEFMRNLTSSRTPQKAINLLQSETRDWEGTFSVGGFHRMLSNGFLSQDANRSNPGGFTIFMFYPKTADSGGKAFGKGNSELLREYLGMDVEESTLEYYMKQGYYTPSTPNDLRIQLKTALDMLELLTCDGTIAGKGLAYVLDPRRWNRLTTVLNDRFNSETEFGAKFCYTLDRHLQTFLDKMTRWEDLAVEGQPRYLTNKAEELLEKLEDGQGLNVVLPVALRAARSEAPKKRGGTATSASPDRPKKAKLDPSDKATDPQAAHTNNELVDEWRLPSGTKYLDVFDAKMPGLKGWHPLSSRRTVQTRVLPRACRRQCHAR
jgi:hypothetical protein